MREMAGLETKSNRYFNMNRKTEVEPKIRAVPHRLILTNHVGLPAGHCELPRASPSFP